MNGFQDKVQLSALGHQSIASSRATIIPWSSRRKWSLVRLAALVITVAPCASVLALPAWYTAGVGGFDPNVPKFYQHQDYMGGRYLTGGNDWEQEGGWCGYVAYTDIFYAVTKQGYSGIYGTAPDPTAGGGSGWYAATYGPGDTSLYNIGGLNKSGAAANGLSLVFTGTGGSVNNVGAPPPSFNGFTPAGTAATLNGPPGGANGFSLAYTPALPKNNFTGTFFTASPGIQLNSGQWTYTAAPSVAIDTTRDAFQLAEGATPAAVHASDIYSVVNNLKFGSVQAYLDANVNSKPANNGKAALVSGTWTVDGNGNVDYLGLAGGNPVLYKMTAINPVQFSSAVMALAGGQEVVRINQGNLNRPPANANGQGMWWAATTAATANDRNYHMLAVSGINVAGNQLYVADPDTNPSSPPGASGVGPANGGWPGNDVNFPGRAPFNLKTSPGASLPVPSAPVVGNANSATWNQLYTDFSFAGNGTFTTITSGQSAQYNGCGLQNIQTIMKNPFKVIGGVPLAGKEKTTVSVTLPSDAAVSVDHIFIEPSQLALDPGSNPGFDSFLDPSEPTSTWAISKLNSDPFGNALVDFGIDYFLSSGTGLLPGETATFDVGTMGEFANEGYSVLMHYAPNTDFPTGFWMPFMEGGTQFDPSAAISAQQPMVPEPSALVLLALGAIAVAGRRRRG
jgi:PEP-CTERM motif